MLHNEKVCQANLVFLTSNIPKHSFILWLALHNHPRTRDKAFKWNLITYDACTFCNCRKKEEEISHLFFSYKFSKEVWRKVLYAINMYRKPFNWRKKISLFERKTRKQSLLSKVKRTVLLTIVYMIWRARNLLSFSNNSVVVN